MVGRLLNRLPLVFAVCIPIAYIAFFIASLWTNPMIETAYDAAFRFVIYAPYAVFITIIFIGKALLCCRTPDRRVALWLVTVTHATGIFAVTLWAVVALLVISVFNLSLGISDTPGLVLRGLSYAAVGGGMVGEGIAAAVIIIGFRTETLGKRIYPWVWQRHTHDKDEPPHVEP